MFIPHHYLPSTWGQYAAEGYSLKLFMPKFAQAQNLDAEGLLSAMRDMYTSFNTIEDGDACVFAKVTAPNGRAVCLRMDRDYTEIYKKEPAGNITTLACWQPAARFKGLSQQDLWCNMVSLLKSCPS